MRLSDDDDTSSDEDDEITELEELAAAALKNKKKKGDDWQHSRAKGTLREDIILGRVTAASNPKDVYEMHASYKKFPFKNFGPNCKALILVVEKDKARMQHDCEAYGHDLEVVKGLRSNEEPGFRLLSWHLSRARVLLKEDMAAGKHQQQQPKDLWLSRPEYQEYSLEVFRKAIHAAIDKVAKLTFRMDKKKFRAPPPVMPPAPVPTLPYAFGAAKAKPKSKGRKKKQKT